MELNNELLSTKQAAAYLSVHVNTIRRWIKEGNLVAVVLNERLFRIKRSDLDALMKGQSNASSKND